MIITMMIIMIIIVRCHSFRVSTWHLLHSWGAAQRERDPTPEIGLNKLYKLNLW